VLALLAALAPFAAAQAGCVVADPTNTTSVCPQLAGASYPASTSILGAFPATPYNLYVTIYSLACQNCSGNMKPAYACATVYTLLNQYCAQANSNLQNTSGQPAPQAACRQDCLSLNTKCSDTAQATNSTLPPITWLCGVPGSSSYLTCSTTNQNDDSCCVSNRDGDTCAPPSWLNTKVAGLPRWAWIFGVGGAVILLIVGIAIVFVLCSKREDVLEVVNPCKWCECCPGYYDL